jgi:hypothetical protein
MKMHGVRGRVFPLVLVASLSFACGSSEEPDDADDERASVLDRDYATIAAAGLRANASAEMAIARARVTRGVDESTRVHAGRMSIAELDVASLLGSADFRAARSAAATALGTRVDPQREQDQASARTALAALREQMQLLSAGATRCEQLGDAAARCAVTLLIIEVKRSELAEPNATASLDASARDGSVSARDASVGPSAADSATKPSATCSDEFEPNNNSASASELRFVDGKAEISAFSKAQDFDLYTVITARRDPVLLTLKFTSPDKPSYLSMSLREPDGTTQWIKNPGSSVSEATVRGWMTTTGVGLTYQVQIEQITGQCTPYTLSAELDACTDAFEDNDSTKQAKPLPAGQPQTATIISTDPDWYDLSALASADGSCNIRYTLPKAGDLGIYMDLQDASGQTMQLMNPVDNKTEQSSTVQWKANAAPARLGLESGWTPTNCLSYTVVCTNT